MYLDSVFDLEAHAPEPREIVDVITPDDLHARYRHVPEQAPIDGVFTIQALGGYGHWRRLGPRRLRLGEPALDTVHRVSATAVERTFVSGSGTALSCAFPKGFRAGEHVVVFAAGADGDQVAPGAPSLTGPGTDPSVPTTYRYKAVSLGIDRDVSVAGPVAEIVANATKPGITVDFAPSAVPANAHLLIVYRQKNAGPWEAVRGLVANPWRFRDPVLVSEPVRVRFVDDGEAKLSMGTWLPATPPAAPVAKQLRTRVRAVAGGVVHLEHAARQVTNAIMVHDAYAPVRRAIDLGVPLDVGAGDFQLHGLANINRVVEIAGEHPETSILRVWDGWGVSIDDPGVGNGGASGGRNAALRDIGLKYNSQNTLPCGNPVVVESDPLDPLKPNRTWPGCILLVSTRARLDRVWGTLARGTGVVFWGWPGLVDGSVHTNCNQGVVIDCSFSSAKDGHGWFFRGSDANQIVSFAGNAVNNEGFGFLDRSFLGITTIGAHTSNNKLGPYHTPGAAAASTYVGCYSEANQTPSSFEQGTVVLGGDHGAGFSDSELALLLMRATGVNAMRFLYLAPGDSQVQIGQPSPTTQELLRFSGGHDDPAPRKPKHVTARRGDDAIQRYYETTAYPAEIHHGVHPRGQGVLEHPRGTLLPGGYLDTAFSATTPLAPFAYYPGDRIWDADAGVARTPAVPFVVAGSWQGNVKYNLGQVCRPPIANGLGYIAHSCSGDASTGWGKSAITQPQWPVTVGGLVQDGTIVWRCVGPDTPQF